MKEIPPLLTTGRRPAFVDCKNVHLISRVACFFWGTPLRAVDIYSITPLLYSILAEQSVHHIPHTRTPGLETQAHTTCAH